MTNTSCRQTAQTIDTVFTRLSHGWNVIVNCPESWSEMSRPDVGRENVGTEGDVLSHSLYNCRTLPATSLQQGIRSIKNAGWI